MFIESASEHIDSIESRTHSQTTANDIIEQLRLLGLDDFGAFIISLPNSRYPKISAKLPRMASEEVQRNWTGDSGIRLLRLSSAFMRSVADNFARYCGRSLDGSRILDFGCGYGRLSRLAYFYTDPQKIFGVDPWDKSIEICKQDGLGDNFVLSDYIPTSLPVPGPFDLIFAFSVFTHTSERATKTCLSLLADQLAVNGMLAITIRPIEFWHHDADIEEAGKLDSLLQSHRTTGYAYSPLPLAMVDNEPVYGNTSMTIPWLERSITKLRVCGIDRFLDDPFQRYVFMKRTE